MPLQNLPTASRMAKSTSKIRKNESNNKPTIDFSQLEQEEQFSPELLIRDDITPPHSSPNYLPEIIPDKEP